MICSGVIAKASSPVQEHRLPLFPIGYELSPCKGGRFNVETLWAGRILTPKRPIAAVYYWLGLGQAFVRWRSSFPRDELQARLNPRPTGVSGRTRPTGGRGKYYPPPSLLTRKPATVARRQSGALNEYFLGDFENFL